MSERRARRLIAVALVAFAAPVSSAGASTFAVNKLTDPTPGACTKEDCSLREAILTANDHAGADMVALKAGKVYGLQVAGANEDDGLTGDLDVSGKLKLEGLGGGFATIDANGLDRVINIFKRTTLHRIEVRGGDVTVGGTGSGGGIEAAEPVRVISSKVTANTGQGAALNAGGAVLHSTVSGNAGRGVGALDTLEVVHSKIKGNHLSGGSSGGGLQANQATIDHSKIIGNTSEAGCGGASLGGDSPTIRDSVFRKNHADGDTGGLCIFSNGTADVTIADSRFSDNTANGSAGGLSFGVVRGTISRVTVSGNEAGGDGGGIRFASSLLKLTRSTIADNHATGSGGGIWADGTGTVSVVNSTIAGNDAAADAGAVLASNPGGNAGNLSKVRLAFTTIAFNDANSDGLGSATAGGIGLGVNAVYEDIHGSLIALNTAPSKPDCNATVTSTGHNLIGDPTGCTGFAGPGDFGEPSPQLGTLGSHGGPTQTVPLMPDSTAINAGGNNGPGTDQRGVFRPQGPRYDIGAFERRP